MIAFPVETDILINFFHCEDFPLPFLGHPPLTKGFLLSQARSFLAYSLPVSNAASSFLFLLFPYASSTMLTNVIYPLSLFTIAPICVGTQVQDESCAAHFQWRPAKIICCCTHLNSEGHRSLKIQNVNFFDRVRFTTLMQMSKT